MSLQERVWMYDATLREGRQASGVTLNCRAMIELSRALDAFGIDYIEVGWPGANPIWDEFFYRIASGEIALKHAKFTAFGSTHRVNLSPESDEMFRILLEAPTEIVTIFGKSSITHVEDALLTTTDRNLEMVEGSVRALVQAGKRVFFDAEHFFQGCFEDGDTYPLEVLKAAIQGGAEQLILCDTNGVAMPWNMQALIPRVCQMFPGVIVGVHLHGDRGMSTANAITAVRAGARHVQGTINGYSERNRMACTIEIASNLHLLMQESRLLESIGLNDRYDPGRSVSLSKLMHRLSGTRQNKRRPFTGELCATHKAGVHASAVGRGGGRLYESYDPTMFGLTRRIVLSGMSGRSNIIAVANEWWGVETLGQHQIDSIVGRIEAMEAAGCRVDVCNGTAAVLVAECLWPDVETGWEHPSREPFFNSGPDGIVATLTFSDIRLTSAVGSGPVDAMVKAVKAHYVKNGPSILNDVHLEWFGSTNIDQTGAEDSASLVRVEIEWTHPEFGSFRTQGVTTNQDLSAWHAIKEAFEFVFYKEWNRRRQIEKQKE